MTDVSEMSFRNCSHKETVRSLPSKAVSNRVEDDESDEDAMSEE